MQFRKPEGTQDLYGDLMRAHNALNETAARVFSLYHFEQIEPPLMEQLGMFVRGVGEATDVVRKEMFRVFSAENYARTLAEGSEEAVKASKRLALRPEGTASVVRAVIENSLVVPGGAPAKLWYTGPVFRGERPAKGRLREFHQIGVEAIGAGSPALDAEICIMGVKFFESLGFSSDDIVLHINSIGDAACRPAYKKKLLAYVEAHSSEFCEDCLERAKTSPLRVLDCKNPRCQEALRDAPLISDELCEECEQHFSQVLAYLDAAGISYVYDKRLVRGLDYYTRTVFEFHATRADLGQQVAVGGGGRYDNLMEASGGKPTPAAGFALGVERVILAAQAQGINLASREDALVYVIAATPEMREVAFSVALDLRSHNIACEVDYQDRSLKSQMKLADRFGATQAVIVGPEELTRDEVVVRDLATHEQTCVLRADLVHHLS